MLRNFVLTIGGCDPSWGMDSFEGEAIRRIQEQVGPTGRVLGAVSGGVDSSVAALLLKKAIGDRFHAVLVDNGLMRMDECSKVVTRMRDQCGINLSLVDASDLFLEKLAGVEDPERKRKIIGATFIEVFEIKAAELAETQGSFDFLMQGTLYPDVIESVSFKGACVCSCVCSFAACFSLSLFLSLSLSLSLSLPLCGVRVRAMYGLCRPPLPFSYLFSLLI